MLNRCHLNAVAINQECVAGVSAKFPFDQIDWCTACALVLPCAPSTLKMQCEPSTYKVPACPSI